MTAANTITKGQTFRTSSGTYTAVGDLKIDKNSISGGYKVLVTDGADEFWHLFGLTDTVAAA